MLNFAHILGRPWAITPEVAELARRVLEAEGFAGLRRLAEFHAAFDADGEKAAGRRAARTAGDVAVIPVLGLLTQRGDVVNSVATTSTALVAEAVRAAAAEPSVAAMVLEFDSPGGEVYGVTEAARVIRDARASKAIVAHANSLAASAAYWLASQADELHVTPSGEVGSIGVYAAHEYVGKELEMKGRKVTLIHAGKYKVEGNPYEELGDEARGAIKGNVDRYYDMFVKDVAPGRKTNVDAVRNSFGEGRSVGAKAAVAAGMADGVMTLEEAIRRAAQLARERKQGLAALASAQEAQRRLASE
jgi:signal peptide peptidase SppA